jgi:hypothetical protein
MSLRKGSRSDGMRRGANVALKMGRHGIAFAVWRVRHRALGHLVLAEGGREEWERMLRAMSLTLTRWNGRLDVGEMMSWRLTGWTSVISLMPYTLSL